MTYLEWIERFSSLTDQTRLQLQQSIAELPSKPRISVILPVYNADLRFLDRALGSVRSQIYHNWELCLADDASTDPRIRPFLERHAAGDDRIKVTFRENNGHISACSNSSLSLAEGEWCALLDQDDELAEDALARVADELARHPGANIVYSDEDFLDAEGIRSNPFFKPDWNPELFLAQNYLNHLGVYRTSLLREIGGFREGFEGSQDYDLALRCVARSEAHQIRHIPRLLYHWRMVAGSLAEEPDAKPYARHAARRAIASYLQERNISARVEACPQNPESHRVIYELPEPRSQVSIITPEGRIVDNPLRDDGFVVEIIHSPAGAAALNDAARRAGHDILFFASRGFAAVERDSLRELVSQAARPEVGAVGARLWSDRGTFEGGAFLLGMNGVAGTPFKGLPCEHPGYFNRAWLQQNFSAISAGCFAIRRELFLELDGFDATNVPYLYYDVDLCLRLRERDLQVVWTPYADFTLAISFSPDESKASPSEENYMHDRWASWLHDDPCYNPNLSLEPPGFILAIPPRTRAAELP